MSLFTSTILEDKILSTVTLIDAVLLGILLLIAIRRATSTATSFAVILCIFLVILFLFLHDLVYTTAEPALGVDEVRDDIDGILRTRRIERASTLLPTWPL